jgi:hypothetical protein
MYYTYHEQMIVFLHCSSGSSQGSSLNNVKSVKTNVTTRRIIFSRKDFDADAGFVLISQVGPCVEEWQQLLDPRQRLEVLMELSLD